MSFIADLFHYAWSFVLILSVIVFIHEFGHYIVAKLCGVKIETFSIGFGKELFGRNDKSGTRWKFSALPFGGYVKMYGDAGAASTADAAMIDSMSDEQKRVSFHFKPLWQKALIVGAGPAANFILTITIMTWFLATYGMASGAPVIGEIMPNTPAAEAGLQKDDRILSVNGKKTTSFQEIADRILTNLGTPVELEIERSGDQIQLSITPMEFTEKDGLGNEYKRPLIGIRSKQMTLEELGIAAAIGEATKQTYQLCATSLKFMGQMITGQRSADDLRGPLGIAELSGQVTKSGKDTSETLRKILWFIALLSANLGLVNLLPVPLLDGGHLLFYAVEGVRGRPMAEKVQAFGYRIGFSLILFLMAFTLFNDVKKLIF